MSFEVERFEWTAAGDRLELAGRWFDVRGRRFLRPTLEVQANGGGRRLLATLEHKPWAAEEGEEWLAAFPWEDETRDIDSAQLIVSPELAIELGPPSAVGRNGSARIGDPGRELAAARAEAKRLRGALEGEREARRAEVDELRERLASVQADRPRLHEAVRRERDAAVAARGRVAAELEEARRELDAARARDTSAEGELRAVEGALAQARAERDAWLSRGREAEAARDAAVAAHQAAVAERDAAIADRIAAESERDALGAQLRAARRTSPPAPTPASAPLGGREPAPPWPLLTPVTARSSGPRFTGRLVHRGPARSGQAGRLARVVVVLALLVVVAALVLLLA